MISSLAFTSGLSGHEKYFIHSNWQFKNFKDSVWYSALIPGMLHSDLLDNKLIKDPYVGKNELEVRKLEYEDWEYKCQFLIDEKILDNQNINLVFEGLDTYATVYLNGVEMIETNNMFRKWSINCKNHLRIGFNTLRIIFYSPLKKVSEIQNNNNILPASNDVSEKKESVYIRKAPFQFGWDWAPRMITLGIWKPVYLECYNNIIIEDVFYRQCNISTEQANFSADIELQIKSENDFPLIIELYNKTNDEMLFSNQISVRGNQTLSYNFCIDQPKLWWCNGWGDPNLYELELRIKDEKEKLLDVSTKKVGIREIELIQENDSIGKSFYFRLNGKNIFVKGANYVPQDVILSRVTPQHYQQLIEDVKSANMNMLRVWGGGIYESDYFYQLCDENGIMVWQDFMFACSVYPGNFEFLDNIKHEVIDNVKRLRQHPCIALWCGNNEIDVAWFNWGWQNEYHINKIDSAIIWENQKKIFYELIPNTLKEYNSEANYVPTSPLSNWGSENNFNYSSMHYWGVWHGTDDFSGYEKNVGRFMSEYGFQSFPEISTLLKFASKDQLNLNSDIITHHQKSYVGNGKIIDIMLNHYPKPKTFKQFVYLSQLTQALGMNKAIGYHRLNKGHCMGTLYWQLNDCWPGPSWSSIDFYRRWKALHYEVKKMYQPFIPILIKNEELFNIYIVSDEHDPKELNMILNCKNFDGEIVWSDQIMIKTDINKSILAYKLDLYKNFTPTQFKQIYLEIKIEEKEKIPESYIYTFIEPKDLELKKPKIEYTKTITDNGMKIYLYSDQFAKNVMISTDGENVRYSDNYFDLEPYQTKTVFIENINSTTPLEIMSLFDCFQ